jgi:hypothetical protein
MEKNVSSHAQSNGAAFFNAKPIKQTQGVQRALPMCNGFLGVVRSTVTACIRLDKRIFAQENVPACMDPILLASSSAVKEQKGISLTFGLVVHTNVVELDDFGLHAGIITGLTEINNLLNARDIIYSPPTARRQTA